MVRACLTCCPDTAETVQIALMSQRLPQTSEEVKRGVTITPENSAPWKSEGCWLLRAISFRREEPTPADPARTYTHGRPAVFRCPTNDARVTLWGTTWLPRDHYGDTTVLLIIPIPIHSHRKLVYFFVELRISFLLVHSHGELWKVCFSLGRWCNKGIRANFYFRETSRWWKLKCTRLLDTFSEYACPPQTH